MNREDLSLYFKHFTSLLRVLSEISYKFLIVGMHARSWNLTTKISVKAFCLLPQHPLPSECFFVTFTILVRFLYSAKIISLWGGVEMVKCSLPHHFL